MSRDKKKQYTNAEKRKMANMPHPQETSDPIEYEDRCSCFHISELPNTGFEEGDDPFPEPKPKTHPYVMKPKKKIRFKPIIHRDGRGSVIKWMMDGTERLEYENGQVILKNMMN